MDVGIQPENLPLRTLAPIVYDYIITQTLIYIFIESDFLKNYDPRHLVFELPSGQLNVDLDLTNSKPFII